MPKELLVFLLSMTPVIELRGAIPLGILEGMEPWLAMLIALAGNILIGYILIQFLPLVVKIAKSHIPILNRFFEYLFDRTRTKHTHRISEFGHIILILFVAVPLPGSGAWSGTLIAYVFGIKKHLAFLLVTIGLIFSALIITFGSKAILAIMQ